MANPSFRITVSTNGEELIILSESIVAKHTSDGIDSKIGILPMDDMSAQTILAREKDSLSKQLNRDKEAAYQQRDNVLGENASPGTVDYYIKAARDILLGFYKEDEQSMGYWGYEVSMSSGKVKTKLPTKAIDKMTLATNILAKNTLEGADSPIVSLDIVDFTAKLNTAKSKHELAIQLNRDKEDAIKKRDQLCGLRRRAKISNKGTIWYYVTQVRDVLLGIYKGNESDLGYWGFDVQYTPAAPSGKKSLTGVVTNPAGDAITGATLTLMELNASVNSGSTGVYSFYKQPAGIYSLRILKSGYIAQNKSVEITDGITATMNVVMLSSGGTLIVNVYSEGAPLPNAVVRILETGVELITGDEGDVIFGNLPAGAYNINVTAPGKAPQTMQVTITNGVTDMLTFDMVNE